MLRLGEVAAWLECFVDQAKQLQAMVTVYTVLPNTLEP